MSPLRPHSRARVSTPAQHRSPTARALASVLPVADALPPCWPALRRWPPQQSRPSAARCTSRDQDRRASSSQFSFKGARCLGPPRSPPLLAHMPLQAPPPPCQHALLPVLHSGACFPALWRAFTSALPNPNLSPNPTTSALTPTPARTPTPAPTPTPHAVADFVFLFRSAVVFTTTTSIV